MLRANARRMLFGALVLLAAGCRGPSERRRVAWPAMGTLASITAAGSDRARSDEFAAGAKLRLSRLEAALSVYVADSDVSRLSRAAGGPAIPVSADAARLLLLARHYGEVSGGAFDPTVTPVMKLWGFSGGAKPDRVPDEAAVAAALAGVGFRRMHADLPPPGATGPPTARLDAPGMALDLGGLAKGYAVDVCYAALRETGAARVIVDLGGNMRCIGAPSSARPWRIGVRNPFNRDEVVGRIGLADGMAVSTSGDYERFVTVNGERFGHIMDPRTGRPVKGMAGVTVTARTAAEADAMSTALFVLGPGKGLAALERLEGCEALWIPDERPLRILLTPGMSRLFTPAPALRARVTVLR